MRSLAMVLVDEDLEARLLLQHIAGGGAGRGQLQRQVHAFGPPSRLRMPGAMRSRRMRKRSHHTESLLNP